MYRKDLFIMDCQEGEEIIGGTMRLGAYPCVLIWYFDIFAMSSENVYRTLLQMKAAGYFKYTNGILFGRVLFDSNFTEMTYEDAYNMAIGDLPYLMDVDIGHSSPSMTMINGAIIEVESSKGKGFINFILK
jgi:muramoyltetrapeptide carboxypeptidase LdcA involved in peptidoglycan recycling